MISRRAGRRPVLLPGCFMVLLALPALASGQDYRPQVGQYHIDFVLPRIDTREPVALSDFRGQKVLLIQFASW